ncbi:dTDP-4-dehydrorhamnose 3,5-epimerase [Flavobacterium sp. DGU11]|uniref:dTDP-4-dehydrorhamnose 3,5-epimerase n=1 Tax=Flavobacterium arundinis TaxID=3139143 RepID=A0ABU9I1L7_9FLAO
MTFTPTKLEGCYILDPAIIKDERGYFMESFNESKFEAGTGTKTHFVQDNQSFSSRGVLRGLHYQTGEHAQAKLVRVLKGEVLDVAVDIRPGSPTFGQHEAVLLSGENQRQFFVPRGFAHGFLVLSETAVFFYKCDNFYNKESEGGIIYNDPSIGIEWGMPEGDFTISEKDTILPTLQNSRAVW